ncbi:MAG: hypothetical protein ABSE73_19960 [Planctomycetota bacterium]
MANDGSEENGNRPDEQESDAGLALAGPEHRLSWWFCGVLGANVAGILWLAVRAESPPYLQGLLDSFMHFATGAVVAYFAFRALFLYAFHLLELLAMVLVLSVGVKLTLTVLDKWSAVGLISMTLDDPARPGKVFQICLLTGSVLLAGAAWGLRHCTVLKLEHQLARLASIVAGMLALPAAAGLAAFPVPLLRGLGDKSHVALVWLLLWLLCLLITGLNTVLFVKTLTLREEITAQEKLAK